jgi:outer membrane protein assembly factor BamB
MKQHRGVLVSGILALASVVPLGAADWASFRGPGAAGVADGQGLPVSWDLSTGKGVRWSTPIAGSGHSSPVIHSGRVFLTTAVSEEPASFVLGDDGGIALAEDSGRHSWRVLALEADTGAVAWDREVFSGSPRARRHVKASQANSTPATDGSAVVAILGSQGMVALEAADGSERWRVDLGRLDPGLFQDASSEWGYASSPIIDEGLVFVQVDRHADSYLAAFDLATGERAWTVERDERPVWASPTIVESAGRKQLVVVGGVYVRGYDPKSGEELWRFHDQAEVKTPTPFAAGELLILAGGYRGRPIYGLRTGGTGDLSLAEGETSGPHVAWTTGRGGPYTSTPVAYDGLLYSVRDEGIFQVHDLATGELVHRERTGTTHSASLVASDGRVYVAAEGGEILVYGAGRQPELLASNDMGEVCMATPAIAGRALVVRTKGHVHSIGGAEVSGSP